LVFLFVGWDSWQTILTHKGPWDHVRAAALCMWATYSLMSFIGIFRPLTMLPLVFFEIVYKIIWLLIVAYPLWTAHQLAGSPAAAMTYAFLWVWLPIVAMPWRYAFDTWVLGRRTSHSTTPTTTASMPIRKSHNSVGQV
jgi:hypothetical protein